MATWVDQASDSVEEVEQTIADSTYLRLRESIIRTELPPGMPLRESELMKRLDTGRTPIREALLRLQNEGFVVVIGRRGTFVSQINISDLASIYEMRLRLEPWATRLAAERFNDKERDEARGLIQALEHIETGGSHEALLELDWRIHKFVYRCSKNPYLERTLDHYHNLSLRILYLAMRRYPALTPALNKVVHEQRAMLEALCNHAPETAEQVATDHVREFEADIRRLI